MMTRDRRTIPAGRGRRHGGPAAAIGALVVLLLPLVGLAPAHAAGDVARGAELFATHCAECHSVREGKDKKGPSLFAVLGRPAAKSPGFVYSDAMRGSGLQWTAENLDAYIAAPGKRVPGGKMKFDGLADAKDRADLIAYLATLTAH